MHIHPQELFSEIGYALWQIQAAEFALVHHIALVLKEPEDLEAFEHLATKEGKRTLGQLIKELRKHSDLPTDLDDRISAFVDERNWIAHRIFKESHSDLHSETKASILLQRIEDLGDEALEVAKIFSDATRDWVVASGVSTERLARLERETLGQWQRQPSTKAEQAEDSKPDHAPS